LDNATASSIVDKWNQSIGGSACGTRGCTDGGPSFGPIGAAVGSNFCPGGAHGCASDGSSFGPIGAVVGSNFCPGGARGCANDGSSFGPIGTVVGSNFFAGGARGFANDGSSFDPNNAVVYSHFWSQGSRTGSSDGASGGPTDDCASESSLCAFVCSCCIGSGFRGSSDIETTWFLCSDVSTIVSRLRLGPSKILSDEASAFATRCGKHSRFVYCIHTFHTLAS
jgi:hypothetical protein